MGSVFEFIQSFRTMAAIEKALLSRSLVLRLVDLNMREVPPSLKKVVFLVKLYLSRNQLSSVELEPFSDLETLALDYNNLTKFPEMSNLKHLVQLNLSHNPLGVLPGDIGSLTCLQVLWVNNTGLKVLPPEIGCLIHLETLGARGNLLQHLPMELTKLQHLSWVTVERNKIAHLGDEFGDMESLVHLNLSKNELSAVPQCIARMPRLQYCFLTGNQIKYVSKCLLTNFQHLSKLDLQGNPLFNHIDTQMFRFVVVEEEQDGYSSESDMSTSDWDDSVATSDINTSDSSDDELNNANQHHIAIMWAPFLAKITTCAF